MELILAMILAGGVTAGIVVAFRIFGPGGEIAQKKRVWKRAAGPVAAGSKTSTPSNAGITRLKKEEKFDANKSIDRYLKQLQFTQKIAQGLSYVKLHVNVPQFMMAAASAAIIIYLCLNFLNLPKIAVWCVTSAAGSLPFFYLRWMRQKYINAFLGEFPNALNMMGNTLRVGHTIEAAVAAVAVSIPAPASTEFGKILNELKIGQTLLDALRHLYARVPHQDVQILITAVSVQTQTGGNLSEVLQNLESTIRERYALRREMRALSGEGRASLLIMMILPFVIVGPRFLTNPDQAMEFAHTTPGRYMYGAAGVLMVLSFLWFKKLTSFGSIEK